MDTPDAWKTIGEILPALAPHARGDKRGTCSRFEFDKICNGKHSDVDSEIQRYATVADTKPQVSETQSGLNEPC